MKRILVAAMHHESNSFNPIVADAKDFNVVYGDEVYNYIRKNDSLSGIVTTLKAQGYEILPTVFARAVPNGEIDYNFYQGIKNEIIKRAKAFKEEGPIDAICLSLHGSMRVKKQGEAEGYLLEELRGIFPNIPIFSSLDMHTTMTKRMHDNCNGFVGYKCAPHTDCTETGEHAARMLIEALENNVKAKTAWVRVPILIAGEQSSTNVQPMISLINALRECEKQEGILAASYLMGFPWADNEDSSVAVYVVAKEDQDLAEKEAIRLADLMWSKKDEFCFHTETYTEEKTLDVAFEAIKDGKFPIYLSDSGDNPTAGSSSDCTGFLRMIMEDERTDMLESPVIFGGIYDPIAVKECEGKVGQEITLIFGAKFDKVTTSPITAKGVVKNYIKDWGTGGYRSDLALFSSQGVDIVIAEAHVGYTTPQMYTDLGRNPKDAQIVVCKLGYLTQQHDEVAARSIMALSKGSTNEDLKTLDYKLVKRPIFPLDDNMEFSGKDYLIL